MASKIFKVNIQVYQFAPESEINIGRNSGAAEGIKLALFDKVHFSCLLTKTQLVKVTNCVEHDNFIDLI